MHLNSRKSLSNIIWKMVVILSRLPCVNKAAVEVRAWISNYILLFYVNVIIHPCSDLHYVLPISSVERSVTGSACIFIWFSYNAGNNCIRISWQWIIIWSEYIQAASHLPVMKNAYVPIFIKRGANRIMGFYSSRENLEFCGLVKATEIEKSI